MRKMNNGTRTCRKDTIRCAIYTRKSHEEGLDQDFNSLDAQRESCEAYILSQKHEGWTCVPEMYDDGGISGATMVRPALVRLLEDIEAERIDAVVVYKVDRLTRSLGDFAKIVEVFDRRGVSFVSVTLSLPFIPSDIRSDGRDLFRFRTAPCWRRARSSVWDAARPTKSLRKTAGGFDDLMSVGKGVRG